MKLFRIYGIIVIVAFIKRSVNCILNKQIKYYTKEGLKLISIVGIALFIIITIILLKFDIAVRVSISGEEIGYVKNKKAFEEKIQNEVLKTENAELESVELAEEPQYKLTFLSKVEDTNEDEIIAKIENDATRTYVRFAVTAELVNETSLVASATYPTRPPTKLVYAPLGDAVTSAVTLSIVKAPLLYADTEPI